MPPSLFRSLLLAAAMLALAACHTMSAIVPPNFRPPENPSNTVDLARKLTSERGLKNVEVLCRDARCTELPRATFDLATARLVLVNVPEPPQIVAEAVVDEGQAAAG